MNSDESQVVGGAVEFYGNKGDVIVIEIQDFCFFIFDLTQKPHAGAIVPFG